MLRIDCPYCGPRDFCEFTYGGDASLERPDLSCRDQGPWYEFVFLRDNPRGRHLEFWHHLNGCRQWLRVERDTLTHEIFSVWPARDGAPGRGQGEATPK